MTWLNLLSLIRKLPFLGIYVVMFTDVLRTFLKVAMLLLEVLFSKVHLLKGIWSCSAFCHLLLIWVLRPTGKPSKKCLDYLVVLKLDRMYKQTMQDWQPESAWPWPLLRPAQSWKSCNWHWRILFFGSEDIFWKISINFRGNKIFFVEIFRLGTRQ